MQVQLPDGSIGQFPDDMSPADIEAVLQKQFGKPVGATEDSLRGFASGAVRTIPQGLDLMGAAVASAVDNTIGDGGDYFKGFLEPRQTPMNDLTTAIAGEEYRPQTWQGKTSKFVGGLVGPGEVNAALKGGGQVLGFGKGLLKGTDNFTKDPAALKQQFLDWKAGIEATPIKGEQVAQDVYQPFTESAKYTLPFASREGLAKVDQLQGLTQQPETSLGYLYGLRKTLGDVDNSIAQPMRESIDAGLDKYASSEGLDAYRRYKTAGAVDEATANMGNETIKVTRGKLNRLDKMGMNPAEIEALTNAGKAGIGEGLLRLGGRATNALPSTMIGVTTQNPVLGMGTFLGGRGLDALADQIAARKIADLQSVIMNGRSVPNMGEKFGGLLNKAARKAYGLLK